MHYVGTLGTEFPRKWFRVKMALVVDLNLFY